MTCHIVQMVVVTFAAATIASAQPPVRSQPPQTNPPRDVPAAQTGTGVISGKIAAAETGRPLRRAQIRLSAAELGREPRTTSTDADGRYEFTDLPAGRYTVSVSRSGYLRLQYGQRRPGEQGKPLQLLDRQTIVDVDFALPRMSVISGRLTDELGEPIAGVAMYALRWMYFDGRMRYATASEGPFSNTDDDGEYRISGLAPGTYIVRAKTLDKWTIGESGRETTMAYSPTYFPGTTRVADATKITLGIGKEASNADFLLIPVRAATLSGTAFDSRGRALKIVSLTEEMRGPAFGAFRFIGNSNVAADGTFKLSNIAPGEYKLMASSGVGESDPPEAIALPIVVDGTDIDNLVLVASAGWSVTGKVTNDNGAVPAIQRDRIRIFETLENVERDPARNNSMFMSSSESSGRVKDDWTFTVTNIFGRGRLGATLPDGWAVKTVLHNGRDITDLAIDMKSGEQLSGVQVIVTDRVATLVGELIDDKGAPLANGTIIVFAADATKWYEGSRFVRAGRPDQKGRYQIKDLLPGDYFAVAVDYVEQGMWNDPQYLESLRSHAQKLTLAGGESQTIALKLITQ
jgi:protocatechuate 3,4-dioxygenase beta subunit